MNERPRCYWSLQKSCRAGHTELAREPGLPSALTDENNGKAIWGTWVAGHDSAWRQASAGRV